MTEQHKNNVPLAIIGMGCFFPQSNGLKAYWHLLFQGKDAISTVPDTHWSPEDYFDSNPKAPDRIYCRRGGFLPAIDFDPTEFGIPPNQLEATDTSQLLSLVAAKLALEDAGYLNSKAFDRNRTSVVLGATGTQELAIALGARLGHPQWRRALAAAGVPDDQADQVIQHISDAYVPWQENSFPGLLGNVIAGRISNRLDLGGTNCVVDAACASSMSALHLAYMELVSERSDMVLTGGVDLLNDIFMHMCFSKTQILSPTEEIQPFSKNADGTLLGEGIGLLVLKRLPDAEKDRDNIYAVIKGMGTSSDGRSQSIYAPRTEGQKKALQTAYGMAGITPDTIELVEAHGTGTRVGDEVEFQTLKQVFEFDNENKRRPWCALGAVKSMIGHTKAAAGSAGLIKSTLALYHKVLPPTLKAEPPDPKLDIPNSPFYLPSKRRPWFSSPRHPRRCGVSAFGFGGSNFHVVLEEYHKEKQAVAWDGSVEILAISRDTCQALSDEMLHLQRAIEEGLSPIALTAKLSQYRKDFSHKASHRLLMVLTKEEQSPGRLSAALKHTAQNILNKSGLDVKPNSRTFYGQGSAPGKLGFLFPGQGSQYVQMAEELICMFPEAFQAVELASQHFQAVWGTDTTGLSEVAYPLPPQTDAEKQAQEDLLRQTQYAQPAIGSISHAMFSILKRFQVIPDACCGHSYGELSALFTAGWLSETDFYTLSIARGRCMAQLKGNPGVMTAVMGPIDDIVTKLKNTELPVVLANRNSPRQGVLSGPLYAIEAIEKQCLQWGFQIKRLPVSNAFHSPMMEHARTSFSEALTAVPITPTDTDVFCNYTGTTHSKNEQNVKLALAKHLVSPVNFLGNLQGLYRAGVRTFLEVGPRAVLSGLAKNSLSSEETHTVSMDNGNVAESGLFQLARTLCQLCALGHSVALEQWESAATEAPPIKMRVPLSGANVRPSKPAAPVPRPKPIRSKPSAEAALSEQSHHATPTGKSKNRLTTGTSQSMDKNNVSDAITKALQVAEQGLKSMQALQLQTAETHQKFLETQTEASRALKEMIASAQRLTGITPSLPPMGHEVDIPTATPVVSLPDSPPKAEPTAALSSATTPPAEPEQSSPLPAKQSKRKLENKPPIDNQSLSRSLLSVVSRLTGYPEEMLGLDMDIESDLGIDSIKRVEILSTLEEEVPGLPDVPPDIMGSLKTLRQIIAHLSDQMPDQILGQNSTQISQTHHPIDASQPSGPAGTTLPAALLSVVSRLTGYPEEMLGLDMDIESDLGIDSIKRVEILSTLEAEVPGLPDVPPDIMGSLKTLRQILTHLSGQMPGDETACPPENSNPKKSNPEPIPESDDLQTTLLSVVSQLTGYPEEMLGLDMDIESDLGIDSIKRVEILSTLEEKVPDLPNVPPDVMGTLKTFRQMISHLTADKSPAAKPSEIAVNRPEPEISNQPETPKSNNEAAIDRKLITVSPLPKPEQKFPSLALTQKLYVTESNTGLSGELADIFRSRGLHVECISWQVVEKIRTGEMSIADACGLVILPSVPPSLPGAHNGSDLLDTAPLADAFTLAKHLAPSLMAAAKTGDALFATVSFMDGAFGFSGKPFKNPVLGGLAGLTKTAAIEWKNVRCHAIDIHPKWQDKTQIAQELASTLLDGNPDLPIEIGLTQSHPVTLEMKSVSLPPSETHTLPITSEDVFVISGGARGITATVAKSLARSAKPILVLLGRSPEPTPEPSWLSSLSDMGEIKKAILSHEFHGKHPKPIELESVFNKHMANREVLTTLQEIETAGAQVYYYAVDVRNAEDTTKVLARVRKTVGPVTGVIHGAGVLEDRLIVDKTEAQFSRVLDTKVKGLENILQATAQDSLRYLVLFSSVAARVGNQGQSDYAMANEVLNKVAQREAHRRQNCKLLSLNWGPWNGGMVTDALRREFENKGISLIPLDAGVNSLVQEISQPPGSQIEVVIGATFGRATTTDTPPQSRKDASVTRMYPQRPPLEVMFNQNIDLPSHPVLKDHQLDGVPVVPFALLTEWIGHTALHNNPGLMLQGMDDMRLLKGIRLDSDKQLIHLMAGKIKKNGGDYRVDVEIRNALQDIEGVLHTKAKAVLNDRITPPPGFDFSKVTSFAPYSRSIEEIYAKILFHGHLLQGITKIHGLSDKGMAATVLPAPPPERWVANPLRSRWIGDPLALDCAFQMACVWCYEQTEMVSLPSYVASYRQFCRHFPKSEMTAVLEVSTVVNHKMTGDITVLDADQKVVAQIKGYEAVMDTSLNKAFKPQLAVNE